MFTGSENEFYIRSVYVSEEAGAKKACNIRVFWMRDRSKERGELMLPEAEDELSF